jgi:hypothetical protein
MLRALLTLAVLMTALGLDRACMAQQSGVPADSRAGAYMAAHGGTLVPAGRVEIDGRRMICGHAATVLDPGERDFGAALPGLIILNPDRFAGLPTPVKLWIFSHECAHLSDVDDETKADCVAVKRGRREGWLTATGLEEVCEFMKSARGDQSHFTGGQRCALMRQCLEQSGR